MHDDHDACIANYSYPYIRTYTAIAIPYKIKVGNDYVNKHYEICDIYMY